MSTQRIHPRGTASVVEPPGGHSEVRDFLALVEVRWPYLDGQGNEVGEEVSTYALRRDETGALKVQVALMQGVSPEG
jgi:hypothetical protein